MPYFRFSLIVFFMQLETFTYMIVNTIGSKLPQKDFLVEEDEAQLLSPQTLWMYLSLLPYCLLMVFEFRSYRQLAKILVCLGLNSVVSYRSFLKYPSRYPRPQLPHLSDERLLKSWKSLHEMDRPGNTFPSLHVGHVYLLGLLLGRELPKEHERLYLLWGTAIALSTVTTKQHYLLDVTGGLYLAEEINSKIYIPWTTGDLRLKDAMKALREMGQGLDRMADHPEEFRLVFDQRCPQMKEFLQSLESAGGFAEAYRRLGDRNMLIERKSDLLAMLRKLRSYVSVANFLVPGLLQFVKDMEDADEHLTDEGIVQHLQQLDSILVPVLEQLFELPSQQGQFESKLPAAAQ